MSQIQYYSEHLNFTFTAHHISSSLLSIFTEEGVNKEIHLNVVFLDDESLLKYNIKFLNHNYYTDIITFTIDESDEFLEAELYISIDRVKDNATQNQSSFSNELNRVLIHGILHLCAYNDSTEDEKKIMREKENSYLNMECFT